MNILCVSLVPILDRTVMTHEITLFEQMSMYSDFITTNDTDHFSFVVCCLPIDFKSHLTNSTNKYDVLIPPDLQLSLYVCPRVIKSSSESCVSVDSLPLLCVVIISPSTIDTRVTSLRLPTGCAFPITPCMTEDARGFVVTRDCRVALLVVVTVEATVG